MLHQKIPLTKLGARIVKEFSFFTIGERGRTINAINVDKLRKFEEDIRADEMKRVREVVNEKVKEYHKECLTDMYINGKFWAYKEMQGELIK